MRHLTPYFGLATLVAGHGFVQNATIGGKEYDFYHPYQDPYMGDSAPKRISRAIQGNGPVENVTSPDLECGGDSLHSIVGSSPAPLHATAEAGSTVNLRWTLWPESHQGPIMTYMARCPDTGCQDYQTNYKPVWFKIAEEGRGANSPDGDWLKNHWATTPLMTYLNSGVNYTIPACLKPGHYLVRHEILALHSAWAVSGAQFYPSCHQLKVESKGNVVPENGLVAFPGVYQAEDPSIHYSMYDQNVEYKIPGPEVFKC